MNYSTIPYFSWIALALALALWAGVGYFAWAISEEQSAHVSRLSEAEQASVRQEAQLRLHALARETKDARTKLEETARRDVVEILEAVERVGRDAGVPVEIGEALSGSGSDLSSSVHSVAFVVKAEGTFTKITHTAALLESLPVPSFLDELQLEQLPSSGSGKSKASSWRLVARMHFLTTADIPL